MKHSAVRLAVAMAWAFLVAVAAQEQGDALAFQLDFDDYSLRPARAGGAADVRGFTDPDLQLRMFRGAAGRGNALTLSNSETVEFAMPGNFDPRQGTVSLWIAPINWKISEEPWQVFFHARQRSYWFYMAKIWPNYINVQGSFTAPDQKRYSWGGQVHVNPEEWTAERWHHLAFTWNEKQCALYVDGVLHPYSNSNFQGTRRLPPTSPEKSFAPYIPFPEASGLFTLGVPPDWKDRETIVGGHQTAYDQVQIYRHPLSRGEVKQLYEAFYPPPAPAGELQPNLALVPRVTTGITLDGRIEATEWQGAALLPVLQPTLAPDLQIFSQAYIQYDAEHLYVAARIGAPCRKAELTQRDGSLWDDDDFEFLLSAPDQQGYHWIVNGNGALYDHKSKNRAWDSGARPAVHRGEDFWSVELQIPLADIGGVAALAGQTWKGNFCLTLHDSLKRNYFTWNKVKGGFSANGLLLFGQDETTLRLPQVGALAEGQLDLQLAAIPAAAGLKAAVQLQEGGTRDLPVPETIIGQPWRRQLPAGDYALRLQVDRGRQTCFRYHQDFRVRRPLELAFDCRAADGVLDVEVDLHNSGSQVLQRIGEEGISGVVMLLDAQGEVRSRQEFNRRESLFTVALPLPEDLTEGTYRVQASTSGEATSFRSEIPFRVPNLAPYRQKAGLDHQVPPPWTPVRQSGAWRYQVWQREYQFDGRQPWPQQVLSAGEPLLAQAPLLQGDLGAGLAAPVWEEAEVTAEHDDLVCFRGRGRLGAVTVDWTAELHFDGAYKIDFALSPEGAVRLQELRLGWEVPPAYGRYFLNPLYVPWQEDRVSADLLPDSRRKDNIVWLTGDEKGMFWWCRSNANWYNPDKSKPILVERGAAATRVTLRLVSAPVELKQTAAYSMVFQGTPSRPVNPENRDFRLWGYGRSKGRNVQYYGDSIFKNRRAEGDFTALNSFIPADPEAFADNLRRLREAGARPIHYCMPRDVSNTTPEFDYLGKSGLAQPGGLHTGVKNGVPWAAYRYCGNLPGALGADLWAYRQQELLRQFPDLYGFYYDVASSNYCENVRHGCGGIDAFGQRYSSSDAWGLRQIFMRSYKVCKSAGPEKLVQIHSHIQFIPLAHAFADLFTPGENTFTLAVNNPEWGYCEEISEDEFLTDYNWKAKGVTYGMLVQQGRAATSVPAVRAKYGKELTDNPEYAMRTLTPFIVYDIGMIAAYIHYGVVEKWWTIMSEVQLNQAEYHGYWQNRGVASADSAIRCGWYAWKGPSPYRRLLVAGNFSRESRPAALQLDAELLGFDPAQATFVDLWNDGRRLSLEEVKNYTLSGNHFMLIGVP